MNTDTDVDLIRDRVKEIITGVRFSKLPSHRAIVELMTLIRSQLKYEYDNGYADGLTKAKEVCKE